MRNRMLLLLTTLAAALAAGCSANTTQAAASGASPAITEPVGPIPGPAVPEKVMFDPYATDKVALQEGRKLFVEYNCAGCHGGHAGGGMGPSLRDPVWIYGNSDAHVFESIAQGRAHGMPAWGTRLPQDQIWKLVAYVKSLRTPLEPEKPAE